MAGRSTDKLDHPDDGPGGDVRPAPQPPRRRPPKELRQPKMKTQLEFWAFLTANTGNAFRFLLLAFGAAVAVAVPFALIAVVLAILHMQFAMSSAMYAGAAAIASLLGVAIGVRRKKNADDGDADDASDDSA